MNYIHNVDIYNIIYALFLELSINILKISQHSKITSKQFGHFISYIYFLFGRTKTFSTILSIFEAKFFWVHNLLPHEIWGFSSLAVGNMQFFWSVWAPGIFLSYCFASFLFSSTSGNFTFMHSSMFHWRFKSLELILYIFSLYYLPPSKWV